MREDSRASSHWRSGPWPLEIALSFQSAPFSPDQVLQATSKEHRTPGLLKALHEQGQKSFLALARRFPGRKFCTLRCISVERCFCVGRICRMVSQVPVAYVLDPKEAKLRRQPMADIQISQPNSTTIDELNVAGYLCQHGWELERFFIYGRLDGFSRGLPL